MYGAVREGLVMFTDFGTYRCFLCLALALGLVFARIAVAEYISPGAVQIVTKRYHPEVTIPTDRLYHYEFTWQGIPVGDASIRARLNQLPGGEMMHVEANARTAKGIDIFYRLRHQSESVFRLENYHPLVFVSSQRENSKDKNRYISFRSDGTVVARSWKTGTEGDKSEFQTTNAVFDPISAAFFARTLPLEVGKEFAFDVFNGKHRYLITFVIEAREMLEVAGKSRNTFRVTPTVKKLTDTEGEKRLHSATLWITDDADRDVVRLASKVWIGRVEAKLVEVLPLAPLPKEAQVAMIAARTDPRLIGSAALDLSLTP